MAQTIDYTNERKQAAVNELRKLWKGENWRVILEKLSAVQGAPHPFINPSTVARLLEDGYQVKHMRERTLEQIHWIINYCKKNNSKEDYNHLLKESAINFPPALQKFINPKPESIKPFADKIIGKYQGYRLSIAEPGQVIRLKLSITYDEKNNALVTKEEVHNKMTKTKEVFEGACVINLAHTGIVYFITRIRKNLDITGILLTVIFDSRSDDHGKINHMNGVVSGLSIHGPFARNVIFVRKSNIETDFISEADFLAESSESNSILAGLRCRIDIPN